MNATIEQLQNGGDLDGGRDKGKALKYQRMKESGALPNHVVHLIEVESKKASSKRNFITNAIHTLSVRETDGTLSLNPASAPHSKLRKTSFWVKTGLLRRFQGNYPPTPPEKPSLTPQLRNL